MRRDRGGVEREREDAALAGDQLELHLVDGSALVHRHPMKPTRQLEVDGRDPARLIVDEHAAAGRRAHPDGRLGGRAGDRLLDEPPQPLAKRLLFPAQLALCTTDGFATRDVDQDQARARRASRVDPGDEDALYEGMRRLFEDAELRRELGAVALRRATEITWHRSALAALEALREAAA